MTEPETVVLPITPYPIVTCGFSESSAFRTFLFASARDITIPAFSGRNKSRVLPLSEPPNPLSSRGFHGLARSDFPPAPIRNSCDVPHDQQDCRQSGIPCPYHIVYEVVVQAKGSARSASQLLTTGQEGSCIRLRGTGGIRTNDHFEHVQSSKPQLLTLIRLNVVAHGTERDP